MPVIAHQQSYDSILTKPTANVFEFRAGTTGNITSVYLYGGASTGISYWNLSVNGATQWVGSNRLQYSSGSGSKTGLTIAVTQGQTIKVSLEQTTSSIGGQFDLILNIEET